MCGRSYATYTEDELYFRYLNRRPLTLLNLSPVYNLCPTMDSPVLRLVQGERQFDLMHWQLIPHWEPTFRTKLSTINAKSEGIFTSNLYGELVLRKRCIIPLGGFFEWKRDGQKKRPFRIVLREEPIMSVAGVWDIWRPGTPEERMSFSILTTSANEFMSKIHNRMPVILGRGDEEMWLDGNVNNQRALETLMKPCSNDWLDAVEVSPLVNAAKNNSPDVLSPVKDPDEVNLPLFVDAIKRP
jgi:putative SOS response-associated peptidase YedK